MELRVALCLAYAQFFAKKQARLPQYAYKRYTLIKNVFLMEGLSEGLRDKAPSHRRLMGV